MSNLSLAFQAAAGGQEYHSVKARLAASPEPVERVARYSTAQHNKGVDLSILLKKLRLL